MKRRLFAAQVPALKTLYLAGAGIVELAVRHDVSATAVRAALVASGVTLRPGRRGDSAMVLPPLIVMGCDVSSVAIGIVVWQGTQVLHHLTLTLPGKHLGARVAEAGTKLLRVWPSVRPDLVAIEGPIFGPHSRVLATYAQGAVAGQLLAQCHQLGIQVTTIAPTAAKKTLSGSGLADKAEMGRCAAAYLSGPYDEHAADALGVALDATRIEEERMAVWRAEEAQREQGKWPLRPRRRSPQKVAV